MYFWDIFRCFRCFFKILLTLLRSYYQIYGYLPHYGDLQYQSLNRDKNIISIFEVVSSGNLFILQTIHCITIGDNMDNPDITDFKEELKGECLNDEEISQCIEIVKDIYIGQNIRDGGILQSDFDKFDIKPIASLLRRNYIKRDRFYGHHLYCTAEKGLKIGEREVTNLIDKNKEKIEIFLSGQPQKILNFFIREQSLKKSFWKFIYPVVASDILDFNWKDRLRKSNKLHRVWTSVLMKLEELGLCIRTHSFVSTGGGELREENYVISPEVFDFLVELCPQEAFTLTDKDYENFKLYGVLSYFTHWSDCPRDILREKLIEAELEKEKIREVIDKMAEAEITSKYRGFQSSEAPFSIKDERRYEDWLEKNLIEPVVEALLELSKEVEKEEVIKEEEKRGELIEEKIKASELSKESIIIGSEKESEQWGIIGKISEKKVLIDLNEPHTISIFGIQGSGKSYTLGVITEMAVKAAQNISNLDKPLASVIFHYSKKETYTPEFESFTRPNKNQKEINGLQKLYEAEPMAIQNMKILVPPGKLEIRKKQYEALEVEPLLFRPQELGAPEWSLLLGAGGEQLYLKQIKNILKKLKDEDRLTVEHLKAKIQTSELDKRQKKFALMRVGFVEEFLSENAKPFEEYLAPGSVTLLDIRDEMLDEQEASILLGMLLISMGKIERDKLLVLDEAHKYFGKTLAKDIVELIREMRHTRTRILIASQDPPSVNARVIELSDVVLLHRMNSPEWLKHIQSKNTALKRLKSEDLSSLKSGEAYIWASKSTEREITEQPMKIEVRPRLTEHGGTTKKAV